MRRDQFDSDAAAGIKPATMMKQRRLHRASIGAFADILMHTISLRVSEICEWLLRGDADSQSLHDIKRFWENASAKVELSTVRTHDLGDTLFVAARLRQHDVADEWEVSRPHGSSDCPQLRPSG